ncbi:MAG: hypothetical protein N2260_06890 [Syntrophobacterales bacterium]|nr:hypothetical protein [Syntrophobacterales bacterium]
MDVRSKSLHLSSIAIIIASLLCYAPTFKIGFIWDDYLYIQQQLASVKEFSFVDGLRQLIYFRPTVTIFSLFDYTIWHRNPLGYHITNFLFHTINSLLVFVLAQRLLSTTNGLDSHDKSLTLASLFAGLIFATHPIHTESVNWVAGRTDLICTTFFLLSFISYLEFRHKRSWRALFPSVVFAVFTAAAKEPGIMLPFVIVAYELLIGRNKGFFWKILILCTLVFLILVVLRWHIVEEIIFKQLDKKGNSEFVRLLLLAHGFYVKKIFWPFPLNFFIAELPETIPFIILGVVSFGGILVSVLMLHRRHSLYSFLGCWWLIVLFPHFLILLGGSAVAPVAERYLYLPSVAFCILLGYALTRITPVTLGKIALGLIITVYGVGTFNRTILWTDEELLWKDTVEKSPRSATPGQWYGNALMVKGKVREAIEVWQRSLTLPYMTGKHMDSTGMDSIFRKNLLHTSIAIAYLRLGERDKAKEHLTKAIELFGNHYHAYYLLGIIEREEALEEPKEETRKIRLLRALNFLTISSKLNQAHQESLYFLGLTQKELNLNLEAMESFRLALELDPRTPLAIQAAFHLEELRRRAFTPVQGEFNSVFK